MAKRPAPSTQQTPVITQQTGHMTPPPTGAPATPGTSPSKKLTADCKKSIVLRNQNTPHCLALHFPDDMEFEDKMVTKPDPDTGNMNEFRICNFDGYAKDGAVGITLWNGDVDIFNNTIRRSLPGTTRAVEMSQNNTTLKIPDPRYDAHLMLQLGISKADKKRGRRYGGSVKRLLQQQLLVTDVLIEKLESDPKTWVPKEPVDSVDEPQPTDDFDFA